MANIKKGARAYYADTDYKRDGMIEAYGKIDGIPTPTAEDVGKVVKVNDEGGYTLGSDESLPEVTSSDNGSIIEVTNGEWNKVQFSPYRILATTAGRIVSVCSSIGVKIIQSSGNTLSYLNGFSRSLQAIINEGDALLPCHIFLDIEGTKYGGIIVSNSTNINAVVNSDNGLTYLATITTTAITLTKIGSITYIDVTVTTGLNAISLPNDMTFDDLKALLDVYVVYIVDDSTHDIYSIEKYDGSYATFRHVDISSAYVSVDSIEFNNLGGTYSQTKVDIST